jgi:hypothetical protein
MLTVRATLDDVSTDDVSTDEDRLAALREEIAGEHLGDRALAPRLRGESETELRADAERLREQARLPGTGRPGLGAVVFVAKERDRRLTERVLGWSEKGAP